VGDGCWSNSVECLAVNERRGQGQGNSVCATTVDANKRKRHNWWVGTSIIQIFTRIRMYATYISVAGLLGYWLGGKLIAIVLPLLQESVLNCHAVCQTQRKSLYLFAEIDRKRGEEMVTKELTSSTWAWVVRSTYSSSYVQAMHEAIDLRRTTIHLTRHKDFREAAVKWMDASFRVKLNP